MKFLTSLQTVYYIYIYTDTEGYMLFKHLYLNNIYPEWEEYISWFVSFTNVNCLLSALWQLRTIEDFVFARQRCSFCGRIYIYLNERQYEIYIPLESNRNRSNHDIYHGYIGLTFKLYLKLLACLALPMQIDIFLI